MPLVLYGPGRRADRRGASLDIRKPGDLPAHEAAPVAGHCNQRGDWSARIGSGVQPCRSCRNIPP